MFINVGLSIIFYVYASSTYILSMLTFVVLYCVIYSF